MPYGPAMSPRLVLRLLPLMLRDWRHHPWRHGLAWLSVALGVALAWSVQLINDSAQAEFTTATRAVNGQPDLSLRGQREGFDDALFATLARDPAVQLALPMIELDTYADAAGRRVAVRVIGVDALQVLALAPQLLPRPDAGEPRTAVVDPDAAYPNATAADRLALRPGAALRLQAGNSWRTLRVAGHSTTPGPALVIMDIAGAQAHFGLAGRLTRIDLRLSPGVDVAAWLQRQALPTGVRAQRPAEDEARVGQLSRAYRVNLTVLALVALFVGGFLVYAVLSLSVAQRTPTFALLGVLGLAAAERRALVLAECTIFGLSGSAAGLALGTALAAAALHWIGADLGSGFFSGLAPSLHIDGAVAAAFGALGTLTAMAAGWGPAREAERLAPAQALKGLGPAASHPAPVWPGLVLLAGGVGLATLPPLGELPVAAYAAVAALLLGGVALVPAVVNAVLTTWPHPSRPLVLLALRRARFQRRTATAATAGVVTSLALSVALTVMVGSFRHSVAGWLDTVLGADLYARSAASSGAAEQAWFGLDLVSRIAALDGVVQVQASRVRSLQLSPGRPAVALVARPLGDALRRLPLRGPVLAAPPGATAVFVSEAVATVYGAEPGRDVDIPLGHNWHRVHVVGVYRDFARQFGSITMDLGVYRRLSGDERLNELALWLAPGASPAAVEAGVRARLADPSMLDFAATGELRAISLRIFDRSFAVTRYLQVVAIAIGLVGIAASLSAQVLARRKEFGLLAHLGLTRRQVLAVVGGEGAAWMAAGTTVGLALGLAVSVVLVHVVNPQSFHWTMELWLPWPTLAALCAAVMLTGTVTSVIAARGAVSRLAVLSVKEDW